jgi:hypothetical protein
MKKVFLIIIILAVSIGGYLVYKELTQKAVIRSEISDRSKKFLSKQKSDNGLWEDANLADNKTQDAGVKNVTIDKCFSFVMPYAVRFSRNDGVCEVSYGLSKPRGTLVIYQREGMMKGFDDVPGVSMRRLHKEKYIEETVIAGGRKFLIFTQTQEEQVLNAFYFEPESYFVVNLLGSASDESKEKLIQLLGTVKFL